VLSFVAAFVAAGCGQKDSARVSGDDSSSASQPELIAQAHSPIPDVPLPIGFKLDEGRSRNFASSGARYVDHVYKGKASRFAVARFYKQQMPREKWVLITDRFVQGSVILDFEKNTERCSLTVSKGSLFNPTIIRMQLWTTSRTR